MDEKYEADEKQSCAAGSGRDSQALRDWLGVRPGTVLEFTEERGRLIAVKANESSPTRRVWGCLGKDFGTDAFISEIRGKR
jgi:hypothetical protein